MTTIAFDGNTLVADGMMCQGTRIVTNKCKKIQILGNTVYAFAGTLGCFNDFIRWVQEGSPNDDMPLVRPEDSFQLLEIADGVMNHIDRDMLSVEIPGMYAVGCGCDQAIDAMRMGMDAESAVKFTSRFDTCTGLPYMKVTWDRNNIPTVTYLDVGEL